MFQGGDRDSKSPWVGSIPTRLANTFKENTMTLWIKLILGKMLGRTAYEVITSPLSKMKDALSKLIELKADEISALVQLTKDAMNEQESAIKTLDGLKKIIP